VEALPHTSTRGLTTTLMRKRTESLAPFGIARAAPLLRLARDLIAAAPEKEAPRSSLRRGLVSEVS
jgi:hypothetical protein